MDQRGGEGRIKKDFKDFGMVECSCCFLRLRRLQKESFGQGKLGGQGVVLRFCQIFKWKWQEGRRGCKMVSGEKEYEVQLVEEMRVDRL